MKAVVIGGGPVGIWTAMLLAKRDLDVIVLDRDPAPPEGREAAWEHWERRSVTQFRQVHFLQAKGRALLDQHLPEVTEELLAAGAVRFNMVSEAARCITGEAPGADVELSRFETITTCRRPVLEAAVRGAARRLDGRIELRNDVVVEGLLTGTEVLAGVPHVVGVRLTSGEEISADVVIDAAGRRTPVPPMIADAGSRAPAERSEDLGFMYQTRYFHGDALPEVRGDILAAVGSISVLTMPGDNGWWSVTFFHSPHDKQMRAVRDPKVFDRVLRAMPLHAQWADGDGGDVISMASTANAVRDFVVDGFPCATGIVPVGDAWGYTNPSLGRGMTLGLMQAINTADAIASIGDDPVALAKEWQRTTEETSVPWHAATVAFDRIRGPEVEAERLGQPDPFDPSDMNVAGTRAFDSARHYSVEVLAAFGDTACCFALPEEITARPGVFDKVLEVAMTNEPYRTPGPTRAELEELLTGA